MWYSKRQATIETSVFGAEFVAMKTGDDAVRGLRYIAMKTRFDAVRGLRYRWRFLGIVLEEPAYCFSDNMSVTHNMQRPESTLKKKSDAICYHYCREAIAMRKSMTTHIRSEYNPAYVCTKLIPDGLKRDRIVDRILYYYNGKEELAAFRRLNVR
jgi:hypothetical protein